MRWTPIEEIATLMIEKRINRVPVLEDGKLVGIITRQNILKSMIEIKERCRVEGQTIPVTNDYSCYYRM